MKFCITVISSFIMAIFRISLRKRRVNIPVQKMTEIFAIKIFFICNPLWISLHLVAPSVWKENIRFNTKSFLEIMCRIFKTPHIKHNPGIRNYSREKSLPTPSLLKYRSTNIRFTKLSSLSFCIIHRGEDFVEM